MCVAKKQVSHIFGAISLSILALAIIAGCGNVAAIRAQISLPDSAALPDGKGAWVVEQKFKTSIGGSYLPGYIYVVIQSDGVVFQRKFFLDGRPAIPWCQDKFTAAEMREPSEAVAKSKAGTWDPNYGPFVNALVPFRALTLTMRDPNGKIVEYKTTLWRFYDLPSGLANLTNAIDAAGDLAFSNCHKSPNNNELVLDKIENVLEIVVTRQQASASRSQFTTFKTLGLQKPVENAEKWFILPSRVSQAVVNALPGLR